ncbi:MAG: hypothetical protein CR996_01690 [Draconibacterium sp.]|nr:MAG: hypothetical protein CR996_01690 [Draconibacterium sp.]PIF06514.1 MAG: hypothetical protein CSA36_01330 [Draconibacterium sp.]
MSIFVLQLYYRHPLFLIIMKYIITTLYCLIAFFSHAQNFSDILGFETDLNKQDFWNYKSTKGHISVVDNIAYNGKAWCFNGSGSNFHTFIYAYLNLSGKADNIKLSLYSLTNNIDKAWLKVWCLDVNEKILKKDSISIIAKKKWQQNIIQILSPGTEKLYIEIEAKADDLKTASTLLKPKMFVDSMGLTVNGKEIELKSEENVIVHNKSWNANIIPDSLLEKHIHNIEDFSSPSIIALGESIHGNGSLTQCAFTTIKYLIREQNCRLVLLEINFELGLWFNEYISSEMEIGELEKRLVGYNFDFTSFFDLLDWIRQYNKNNDRKVIVLGMDIYIFMLNLSGFDYLSELLKIQGCKHDSVQIFSVYCKKKEYEKAKDYIVRNDFLGIDDTVKRKCILRAIDLKQTQRNFNPLLLYNQNSDKTLIEGDRDFIQYQNTRFAVDSLLCKGEKAVIYAHLGHVNKRNIFGGRLYIPSLGYYLNQYYKDNYYVIALLVGKGTYSNTDHRGSFNPSLPLQLPPANSLENLLLEQNVPFLFTNTKFLAETYSGRNIGMFSHKNQFYPYNKNRFDAVMFLQYGKGYELPEKWPLNNKNLRKFIDEQRIKNGHKKFFK